MNNIYLSPKVTKGHLYPQSNDFQSVRQPCFSLNSLHVALVCKR